MTVPEVRTLWAEKANRLYDATYAKRYRAHDDQFDRSEPCVQLSDWLKQVCGRFDQPIDVLDLGCGTGRYFWALTGVRELVGLDASAAMLAEARRPYHADRVTAQSVTLVEGDLLGHEFGPARFDLIYSIGVLAEHAPLDERIVSHVAGWLRPRGRFAFTTVHPESPSIPATVGRRLGRRLWPVAPGRIRTLIRARLLSESLYADEARVRELLAAGFEIEALERFQSEAHLHCLCVATKRAA